MNIIARFAAVIIGLSLVTGCTSMTQGEFNNLQATIGGSPAAKREAINDCIVRQRAAPMAEKKRDARLFNISMARFPETYCGRLWNAFASGRITYADYLNLGASTADSSKVIRIMQGH